MVERTPFLQKRAFHSPCRKNYERSGRTIRRGVICSSLPVLNQPVLFMSIKLWSVLFRLSFTPPSLIRCDLSHFITLSHQRQITTSNLWFHQWIRSLCYSRSCHFSSFKLKIHDILFPIFFGPDFCLLWVQYGPTNVTGESPIHRCSLVPEELVATPYADKPEINTPWHCIQYSAKT